MSRHQPLHLGHRYHFIDSAFTGGTARLIGVRRDTVTGAVVLALTHANGFTEMVSQSDLRLLARLRH